MRLTREYIYMFFVTIYVISGFVPKKSDLQAIYGYFNKEMMITHQNLRRIFFSDKPAHGYVPLSFLLSNCFFFGGYYKSSLFLSCFHPQGHSRSSSPSDTVALACHDGQSFHQSRGYWSQKKGYKSKYHRDMGYGVKMRIYVFLEQCMHFCIFQTNPMFRQTCPCGFHGYVPLNFLVSNLSIFGGCENQKGRWWRAFFCTWVFQYIWDIMIKYNT